jgi:hypothetical protein
MTAIPADRGKAGRALMQVSSSAAPLWPAEVCRCEQRLAGIDAALTEQRLLDMGVGATKARLTVLSTPLPHGSEPLQRPVLAVRPLRQAFSHSIEFSGGVWHHSSKAP